MFADDRRARMAGKPPAMIPVVAEDPAAPSALPTPDSWKWFTETGRNAERTLAAIRLGLDALLDMGTATFWRRVQPPVSCDAETFDRAFEVRMLTSEILGVDEQDRLLMAPKLRAKLLAISTNLSGEEVFRVRAVSSQIGWLETSMADAAAEAVSHVELLLSTERQKVPWRFIIS
jgi:hypothetical protein